VPPAA